MFLISWLSLPTNVISAAYLLRIRQLSSLWDIINKIERDSRNLENFWDRSLSSMSSIQIEIHPREIHLAVALLGAC